MEMMMKSREKDNLERQSRDFRQSLRAESPPSGRASARRGSPRPNLPLASPAEARRLLESPGSAQRARLRMQDVLAHADSGFSQQSAPAKAAAIRERLSGFAVDGRHLPSTPPRAAVSAFGPSGLAAAPAGARAARTDTDAGDADADASREVDLDQVVQEIKAQARIESMAHPFEASDGLSAGQSPAGAGGRGAGDGPFRLEIRATPRGTSVGVDIVPAARPAAAAAAAPSAGASPAGVRPAPGPAAAPPGARGLVGDPRAAELLEWLEVCGLGVPPELTEGDALEDPLRNGEVLCHLARTLSGGDPEDFYQPPGSDVEARENVGAALEVLQNCGLEISDGETGAVAVVERVVRGHWGTVLDLLLTLRRIFERTGQMQDNTEQLALDLPRTVAFLEAAGVRRVEPGSEAEPMTRSALRSGAVFCLLATAIGRVHEVSGAIARPRTEAQCRRNVTLGLAALDLIPGVAVTDLSEEDLGSPTFVEVEGVLAGDPGACWGALNQARLLFGDLVAGVHDRRTGILDPHFKMPRPQPLETVLSDGEGEEAAVEQQAADDDLAREESEVERAADAAARAIEHSDAVATPRRGAPPSRRQYAQLALRKSQGEAAPAASFPADEASASLHRQHERPASARASARAAQAPASARGEGYNSAVSTARGEGPGPASKVERWLRALDLSVGDGTSLVDAVADGVLLCKIASLLRGDVLDGVNWCPRSPAAAMQNFRKGLAVLSSRMGSEALLLPDLDDVLAGGDARAMELLSIVEKSLRREWVKIARARAGGRFRLSRGGIVF